VKITHKQPFRRGSTIGGEAMVKRQKNAYSTYVAHQTHTPQNMPIPGSNQVPNSAGGYSFALDSWSQMTRFLVLGSEGGSYYASERKLTEENAKNVVACILADGPRAVQHIVDVSRDGRAPRNTPAIFALALATAAPDVDTRQAAVAAIPQVCRTATHLFQFAGFVQGLRGWGRALRRGVGNWYTEQDVARIAYQVVKYRQRDGWTHTDLMRLGHPKPKTDVQDAVFRWVTKDEKPEWATGEAPPEDEALRKIWAFEWAQRVTDVKDIVALITEYDLVREAIPTQFLNEVEVWDALLQKMPMTAMIRNLGNMSKIGLLKSNSDAEKLVVERLTDGERLKRARVHPIAVLSAMRVYESGQGFRGKGTWKAAPRVVDALETAFYKAFGNVEPANKRTMLALDVSGSMGWGDIAGVPRLTPRVGSAAMAMVTARTEPQYMFTAFSSEMVDVKIRAKWSLDQVIQTVSAIPMGGTDCALPMIYAREQKIDVDTFIVYTDSETWYGAVHPVQALRDYRQATGIPAKLIVVGMISNGFSIADPSDGGMLDVVGFDTAAPGLMNAFARGEV
jgi:60 kDa SS-A/Ro ribonucleoprotein